MRRINYKSDIPPLLLSLKVDENQITVPDCDFIVRFYIEGYEGRHYDCSHIGGVWSNCEPSEDGTKLVCYINNQRLGIGELCAEFHYISPDRRYSDGSQKSVVVIGSTELGVELVEDNGDAVTKAAIDVTLPFIYRTAYEIAREHGYTGTAEDFYGALASVVGIADAEKKRVTAEITRNANEQERIENEENRLNAENVRVNAEAQRVRYEAIRCDAESDRVEQEEDRKAKFEEITEFIATVRANEGNRESNELERQTNEGTRITEEAKRVAAEKKRAAEFEQQKLDLAGKIDRSGDEMGGDLIFTDNAGVSFSTSGGGAHTMFNDTDDVAKFTADNGDTFEFRQNETPNKNSSALVVSANLYNALDMTLDSMGSALDGDFLHHAEDGDKIFNPDTGKIQRYNSTIGGFEDLCDPIEGKLYVNKLTGYIYRWNTKAKKMVFVGGVKAYTKEEADSRFAKLDDATQRVKVKELEAMNFVSAKSIWIGDEGLLLGGDGNGHLTVEQDEVITDVTLNGKLATKADDVAYGVEWYNGQPTGEMQETTVKEATKNTTVAALFLGQSYNALEQEVEKKADQDSVDSIETRILPIENVIYSLLDGFNEIPSDGYGRSDTAVSFIFPTIYKEDTKISKVSLKRNVTDTTHAFKIASVIKNSSNQLIVNTLSDSIELPVVETNGIVNDFIVDYTIPANTQVALVFDKGSLLYTSSSATACLSNTVVTAFDNLTIGNRLANEGSYTSQAAISIYTKEVVLKPLVTQAELDAEGVRLEGLISAEETARENADGNLHNEILDVSSDIDKINTDLIPLKELKDVLVEGFNEVPSQNGLNITLPVIIFKEVYKRDATITSLKIKVKEGDSTRKIRIASCIKNASNQVLVVTISDAITIPQTDSVETVEIQLETPFTIPKGHQFALMGNTTFIKHHKDEPASVAYINSYVAPTGTVEEKFNGVTTGTRLITIGSSENEYKVFVAAYENKLAFKNFATKSELGAVENKVKEYTDENIVSNQKDIDARRTLLNSVVVSKYKTELMAHGSLGIDGGNGYFYIIYYGSETQRPEGISSNCICRLSKVSQCNLYDSEVIDVLKKGETVANFIKDGSQVPGGFTQSSFYSPYDPNLLLVDITKNDVTTSYIRCIMTIADSSFIEGDTSADRWQHVGIGYRDVNRDTLSLSDTVVMSNLRYTEDNVDYDVPFTIAELNNMICRHFKTSTGRIGTYPLFTSKFVSYNGDIYGYLGGLNAKTGLNPTPPYDFAGVMLKSSDNGTTWEVVAWGNDVYTTFGATELAMWEAAMDIIGSRMYVIFKSLHSYIAYYDLANNTWSKLIPLLPYSGGDLYVGESSSRPHIYAKGNYLYAMVNVDPAMRTTWLNRVYRSRVHIMKIDTDMNIIDERELLDDGSCQYFSVINQRGRDYILFTEDKAHLGYIYDPGLQQYTFRGKSNISLCVLDIFN